MELGVWLVETYSMPMVAMVATNIFVHGALFFGGVLFKHFGGKWLGKVFGKLGAFLGKKAGKTDGAALKKALENLGKGADALAKNSNTIAKSIGGSISKVSGTFAMASSVIWFMNSKGVRMGISGLIIFGGMLFVNMMFAFILIESMLFFGASLIIFPLLAVCYVYDKTRSHAVSALKGMMDFAVGLIFISVAVVMGAEANDWILGGIFTNPDASNMSDTRAAIDMLRNGNVDGFTQIIGSGWYFLFALLAVMVNGKLLSESSKFAGWFTGKIGRSKLGDQLYGFGSSTLKYVRSASRSSLKMVEHDFSGAGKDDITAVDRIHSLVDDIGSVPGRIRSVPGRLRSITGKIRSAPGRVRDFFTKKDKDEE
jgi:hypothetical protein